MNAQDYAALQSMLFIVFASGVFVGAACTGFMTRLINLLSRKIQYPDRVKVQDGYLYRDKHVFMSLEQRNLCRKKRRDLFMDRVKNNPEINRAKQRVIIMLSLLFLVSLLSFSFFAKTPLI
jgi:hypothetical protein